VSEFGKQNIDNDMRDREGEREMHAILVLKGRQCEETVIQDVLFCTDDESLVHGYRDKIEKISAWFYKAGIIPSIN
jgi:hypothetical protein